MADKTASVDVEPLPGCTGITGAFVHPNARVAPVQQCIAHGEKCCSDCDGDARLPGQVGADWEPPRGALTNLDLSEPRRGLPESGSVLIILEFLSSCVSDAVSKMTSSQ